jgi:DNA-binding MarR family transcriptional regulator/GNAT superfamily N-acetyltransferase
MDSQIADVRRFNRTVTASAGALDDRFMGRGRPLGAARLLWEIGPDGCEVRALRERLELDSGYVSRLLRSLEAEGLVAVVPGEADRRTRIARLTATGRRERETLDARSDAHAAAMLEPLDAAQRERLVAAMRTVERLLTAGLVEFRHVDAAHPDAQRCLHAYYAELNRRSERGFDPSAGATAHPHEVRPPHGDFLVLYLHGEAVGCGGVKFHPGEATEIKRMWLDDRVRGMGLGRRLLAELEALAVGSGATLAHIETNACLTEAIAMYRRSGYVEVPAFNDEPFADHWFEKRL